MRRSFAWGLVLAVLACGPLEARAEPIANADEPSRGDPKIYALLARQDFERDVLKRGTTLWKVFAAPGRHRLPPGYKWGRCLLEVDGRTLISGRCSYKIEKGGAFRIAGPRQIFSGFDYPVPEIYAGERSRDYWAYVYPDDNGWTAYGNKDVTTTHGDWVFDMLERRGACRVNDQVRVCLWRE